VAAGTYREHITIPPKVTVMSARPFAATLNGGGRGNVVTLSNGSTIAGLDIRGGAAGVFSRTSGARITHCRIHRNRGSGIMCVGSLPLIEDNLIVFNRGSGIQGIEISSGANEIVHNTIAYNDNNGILLNTRSKLTIRDCILASNRGMGVKIDGEESKVLFDHNLFHANGGLTLKLPKDNFSFSPGFVAPRRRSMNFSLAPDSKARGRGTHHEDLGARLDTP
jgi:nitrous oxidase accessory protein NosD